MPFALALSLLLATPGPRLYAEGAPVAYPELLAAAAQADVVLLGELHGHPVGSAFTHRLARDLAERLGGRMALGAEMIEADDQLVLDEYLAGLIREQDFIANATLWDNHAADYAPLVELARERGLRFVASNVPRRYAALVAREGLSALQRLSPAATGYLAPLPMEVDPSLTVYRQMAEELAGHGAHGGLDPAKLVQAQALKDATMAHRIHALRPADTPLLHLGGALHSAYGEGIAWYLKRLDPGLRVLTVTMAETPVGESPAVPPTFGDFVVAVPPAE